MKKLVCKCDSCGVTVDENQLLTVPNPSYSGNTYYPVNVPFSVTPRNFELCCDCVDKLVLMIRDFCTKAYPF